MNPIQFSDEQLNAFADGELATEERLEVLRAASHSASLRDRLLEIQYLKESTRAAFPTPTPANQANPPANRFARFLAVAAVALLSLLAILSVTEPPRLTPVTAQGVPAAPGDELTGQTRVVFHISSDNPQDAALLLEQVSLVLEQSRAGSHPIRVEVVANNQGLRLLQRGRSDFEQQIRQLSDRYPNLLFAACGNTLERLQARAGETIEIIPEAVIVRSGISYITRRQQHGWAYIKV